MMKSGRQVLFFDGNLLKIRFRSVDVGRNGGGKSLRALKCLLRTDIEQIIDLNAAVVPVAAISQDVGFNAAGSVGKGRRRALIEDGLKMISVFKPDEGGIYAVCRGIFGAGQVDGAKSQLTAYGATPGDDALNGENSHAGSSLQRDLQKHYEKCGRIARRLWRFFTKGAEKMDLSGLKTEQINAQSENLDIMPTLEAARLMNRINADALAAVDAAIPAIAQTVELAAERVARGGRLIYAGAGTSGRLGVLDASECPPTFGVDSSVVMGVIAGGDTALRNAVEGAEDSPELGAADMKKLGLNEKDCLVAISASGRSPYCVGALDHARAAGALAICMACNTGSEMAGHADVSIEMPTGPEMLSGSTRLKAGTATKLALNMLSTLMMTRLGKVYKNLMVDMRPSNVKLKDRARRMVQSALNLAEAEAADLLAAGGDVKHAIVMGLTGANREEAHRALSENEGRVRQAAESLKPEKT